MNRQIIFRAWDEVHKLMHSNFQFFTSGDEGNDWILFASDQKPFDKDKTAFDPYFRPQLHIMQFTGLKDKNGTDIYESDLVKDELTRAILLIKFGHCLRVGFTGWYADPINHDGRECSINNDAGCLHNSNIVVIGNIHENPELLK